LHDVAKMLRDGRRGGELGWEAKVDAGGVEVILVHANYRTVA